MRWLFGWLGPERRREVLFSVGLLALALPAAAGGEALLRVLRLREEAAKTVDWNELRAELLYRDEAGFDRFIPGARSGNVVVNRLALPGPEITVPKPPETLRLAFLGDSILLAASLPQDRTPSAVITAAVAEAFPDCRVDYVTIAGPDFHYDIFARHLAELDPGVQPDAYLLLAGSVEEALERLEAEVGADPPYLLRPGRLARHSELWLTVSRSQHAAAPLLGRIDLDLLAGSNAELLDRVAGFIGDAPTIAVVARNRSRQGMSQVELSTINQRLLSKTGGGLTLEGLARLEATLTHSLAEAAEERGWRLLDALTEVPPDSAHYEDEVHLTAAGVARLAAAVSGPLIEEIAADPPDCAVTPRR
jgi:hypothetical protein